MYVFDLDKEIRVGETHQVFDEIYKQKSFTIISSASLYIFFRFMHGLRIYDMGTKCFQQQYMTKKATIQGRCLHFRSCKDYTFDEYFFFKIQVFKIYNDLLISWLHIRICKFWYVYIIYVIASLPFTLIHQTTYHIDCFMCEMFTFKVKHFKVRLNSLFMK